MVFAMLAFWKGWMRLQGSTYVSYVKCSKLGFRVYKAHCADTLCESALVHSLIQVHDRIHDLQILYTDT